MLAEDAGQYDLWHAEENTEGAPVSPRAGNHQSGCAAVQAE